MNTTNNFHINDHKISELLELAWLDLGLKDLDIRDNPLRATNDYEKENPHILLLKLLRNPDYFGFTCKHIFNIELLPFQMAVLKELWTKPFIILVASRGSSKSMLLGLYAMVRALFHQDAKIIIVGTAFRQAKIVFEYCEHIWANSPLLRDIVGTHGRSDRRNGPYRAMDRVEMVLGSSLITGLPIGTDGGKIRGARASYLINDEFQDSNRDIFENVISGFASVSSSPVDKVKDAAKYRILKELGVDTNLADDIFSKGYRRNQTILSGTATYQFNHMYDYWMKYKSIIESKGDKNKLMEIFGDNMPPKLDWRDYSVIRIPCELLPEKYMDEAILARSKATMYAGMFEMEFQCKFMADSAGFFKRSLVESCVTKKPIPLPSGGVMFGGKIDGDARLKYVFAVDPASEHDNFAITVLEVWPDHRRVVYCWTTTRKSHKEQIKKGFIKENNFYAYCARKIRNLMKTFSCERIAIDSQGGGYAVLEALHDNDKLQEGELCLWETITSKVKDSDDKPGLHIIELVHFSNNKWLVDANHGLKKDLMDKVLLFPYFDPVSLSVAAEEDNRSGRTFDTLEDCVFEIEAMKDEIASIQHSLTAHGVEHWDTPAIQLPGGKRGKSRKDRYTSLLMANSIARNLHRNPIQQEESYVVVGGLARQMAASLSGAVSRNKMYTGPAWFTDGLKQEQGSYGRVVRKK